MKCEICGTESAGRLCLKCQAEQGALPIPASFFSPEESAGRHTFPLPDDNVSSGGGFTIHAQSLQIEAVSSEAPELPELPNIPDIPAPQSRPQQPQQPKRPAPALRPASAQKTAAAPDTPAPKQVSSEPIQTPQGFYLVPYDESVWATLARIRHKWMLPVIVGVIFVSGLTTGILLARSASEKRQNAESSAEDSAAETTAPPAADNTDDLLTQSQLLLYFSEELLPQYGYLPENSDVTADRAGVISVCTAGTQMTVLRLEDGALIAEAYVPDGSSVKQKKKSDPAALAELSGSAEAQIIGDANGIYLGSKRIADFGLGTAETEAPRTLCTCRSADSELYQFTDQTGVRDTVPVPEGEWNAAYTSILEDALASLPAGETAQFRLLQIDADDLPELELQCTADGATAAKLYTFSAGEAVLLTADAASEYVCVPQENCWRETVAAEDGTFRYWYHLENGAAVRDHTEWFGIVGEDWLYRLDGEEHLFEEYSSYQLPEAEALEKDITYIPLNAETIKEALA